MRFLSTKVYQGQADELKMVIAVVPQKLIPFQCIQIRINTQFGITSRRDRRVTRVLGFNIFSLRTLRLRVIFFKYIILLSFSYKINVVSYICRLFVHKLWKSLFIHPGYLWTGMVLRSDRQWFFNIYAGVHQISAHFYKQ